MGKVTQILVLAVFVASCLLAWTMLTLMLDIRSAGRVLPFVTNVCIGLRPLFFVLPLAAAAYAAWPKTTQDPSHAQVLVFSTMLLLLIFVLPAITTSYLLMADQVRRGTGNRGAAFQSAVSQRGNVQTGYSHTPVFVSQTPTLLATGLTYANVRWSAK